MEFLRHKSGKELSRMAEDKASFLSAKMKTESFWSLFKIQIESVMLALVKWVPSLIGMAIRNVVYRILGMKIKGFCWIQPGVTIVNLSKLRVGKNFGCNSGTYINAVGGIRMGNDVLIGSNVTISSGKHEIKGRQTSVFSRPTVPMPIVFGDDVWLGAGVSVLPGIQIADGTVVGANAVVTKSTEPYSVMAGIPARLVRYR
jgi:maltose O-acetyltransferase